MVNNPNWQEADQLVIYITSIAEELNSGLPRNNSSLQSERGLDPGPPDFKSSALTHLTTLPPWKGMG